MPFQLPSPLAFAAFLLACAPFSLHGQGSLTPPGAPAAGMKSLDQVEARIPISSAPYNITQSGSYYLTGNLSVTSGTAINITAENVTLDLNGYTISSTAVPASGYGVAVTGLQIRNFHIRNGHVRGATSGSGSSYTQAGFLSGIYSTNVPYNVRISDISVYAVGQNGIDFSDDDVLVERCVVDTCSGRGILAGTVIGCWTRNCGGAGISAKVVSDSRGVSSGNGHGIDAEIASNCQGQSSSGSGIFATNSATNCTGTSVSGPGLQTEAALNCRGTSTSGVGLIASLAQNCSATSISGAQAMLVSGTAQNCRGQRNGGVAISAGVAIGCTVAGTGTVTATSKFLGTP